MSDIANAQSAIAICARLIQSEAADMAAAPNEDCDIALLLQAVSALRGFISRERGEPGDPDMVSLSATPDLEKAKYNAAQLQRMPKDGEAFRTPQGAPSSPIGDKEALGNAIRAVGRGSGDHDAIRSYITRRAKALGASDMIPDSWSTTTAKTVETVGEPG